MAAIVLLAAGAFAIASCSKEENSESVKPRLKDGDIVEKTAKIETGITYSYWDFERSKCVKYYASNHICQVDIVGIPLEPEEVVAAEVDVRNGYVRDIRVFSYATLPNGIDSAFADYVSEGYITFDNDCVIEDPQLLQLLYDDYIPAGQYAVHADSTDAVITINGSSN